MILGAVLAAALATVPQPTQPTEAQAVLWQDRTSRAPLVQVLRGADTGQLEVRVDPAHLYQRVVLVIPTADGAGFVRVEMSEAHEEPPRHPAIATGLRDLDSIGRFYRVEFEVVKRTGQTRTIFSGPAGYLVRVVTRHTQSTTRGSETP